MRAPILQWYLSRVAGRIISVLVAAAVLVQHGNALADEFMEAARSRTVEQHWSDVMSLKEGQGLRVRLREVGKFTAMDFVAPNGAHRIPDTNSLLGTLIDAQRDHLRMNVAWGAEHGSWTIPRSAIRQVIVGEIHRDSPIEGVLLGGSIGLGISTGIYLAERDDLKPVAIPLFGGIFGGPLALLFGWLDSRRPDFTAERVLEAESPEDIGSNPLGEELRRPGSRSTGEARFGTLAVRAGSEFGVGAFRRELLTRKIAYELHAVGLAGSRRRSKVFDSTGRAIYPEGSVTFSLMRLNYYLNGEAVRPYVSAGAGVILSFGRGVGGPETSKHMRKTRTSGAGFIGFVGTGVELPLGSSWEVRPEVGWLAANGGAGISHSVPVVSVALIFGSSRSP